LEARKNLQEALDEVVGKENDADTPVFVNGPWTDAKEAKESADTGKGDHEAEVLAYVTAYNDARQKVIDLVAAANDGTDETTDMESALLLKTNATGAKESAVALQRARVEAVVMSRMTQDDEVTRWTARLATANTANDDANTVLQAAIGDVTAAQEQMTTRAWIYSVMRFIDADLFHTACDSGVPRTQCGL
jgi:hypothetical protein